MPIVVTPIPITSMAHTELTDVLAAQHQPAATSGQVLRTAGNLSTTSTTLVDVLGATVTITTGVFPVAYGAFQSLFSSATNNNIALNVDIDGGLELGATGTEWLLTTANFGFNGSFSGQSAELTAAEHTIKMQWKGQGATVTLYANSDVAQLFWAYEIR